jgi:hypothetical protein
VQDGEIEEKMRQLMADQITREVDRANIKYEKHLDLIKRRMYQYELNFREKETYFNEIPNICSEL